MSFSFVFVVLRIGFHVGLLPGFVPGFPIKLPFRQHTLGIPIPSKKVFNLLKTPPSTLLEGIWSPRDRYFGRFSSNPTGSMMFKERPYRPRSTLFEI